MSLPPVENAQDDKLRVLVKQCVNRVSVNFTSSLQRTRQRTFGGRDIDHETQILNHIRARGSAGFVVQLEVRPVERYPLFIHGEQVSNAFK